MVIQQLEQAGDDAHEALKTAEQTGYIWPKAEALELLAAYHQAHQEARQEFEKQIAGWYGKLLWFIIQCSTARVSIYL
jgi:hypothetical protein